MNMKIYEHKSQFGWPDDNGIGEKLIQQIIQGIKTATAGPKSLYTPDELKSLYDSVGQPATVIDKAEEPRCNILIEAVFETTFGNPDPRLVFGEGYGEGYGENAEAFKQSHKLAWQDLVLEGKLDLKDETVLVVEIFKLI